MTINGLLPIGSVVLLKNSTKRVMIMGVCQGTVSEGERRIYDYVGCFFPEGYMSADKNFLFNQDQIDRLFAIGYQLFHLLLWKRQRIAHLTACMTVILEILDLSTFCL